MWDEQHSKSCFAQAMISAIENARDSEHFTNHEFALWVQDQGPRTDAFEYLNTELQTCTCGAHCMDVIRELVRRGEYDDADQLAKDDLKMHRINVTQ
jgi:hypothetical protein